MLPILADKALKEAVDGVEFLSQNIVQGTMDKPNTFSIKVDSHHASTATSPDNDDELGIFGQEGAEEAQSSPHGTVHIRTAEDSLNPLPEENGCCGGHDHGHDHDESAR